MPMLWWLVGGAPALLLFSNAVGRNLGLSGVSTVELIGQLPWTLITADLMVAISVSDVDEAGVGFSLISWEVDDCCLRFGGPTAYADAKLQE
ncbi:hypothetical protein Nepgr_016354 [Nepenthes gracilis]|uniref:Uncharacterized protein n=1 Tax=Nepenthes gracilis TaxID=150966 RepID=A0AAD3SND8_NEPGR|nr:hypothetical protein Nepgr_016354 [Nepenthes gracilis]